MRTPSPPYCGLDLAPPLADRFVLGVAPIDYGPALLRIPFGFRLATDTLSSEARQAVASGRSCLFPAFAFVPWQRRNEIWWPPSFRSRCQIRHRQIGRASCRERV